MIYDTITIERIVQQAEKYYFQMTNAEKALIRNAYAFALKYHDGQTRLTGESYIFHALRVISIGFSIGFGLAHGIVVVLYVLFYLIVGAVTLAILFGVLAGG